MDRNHVHLCKQIGGTWIRRKKRANIAIYIDVQEARQNGLKFFSAPNEVILCSGDTKIISKKYFKEIQREVLIIFLKASTLGINFKKRNTTR